MTEPATIAAGLLVELGLAEAAEHARAGRYAEAEAVLARLSSRAPAGAAQLDLLARIRAQQGHPEQAEALWDEALALDPGRRDYRAGRDRARRGAIGRAWLARAAVAALALLAVAGCAAAAVLLLTRDGSRTADAPEPPATPLHRPEPRRAATRGSEPRRAATRGSEPRPAATRGSEPRRAATRGSLPPKLRSKLAFAGIETDRRAGRLVVTFVDGLFASGGTELTAPASALLTRVGRQLKPFARRAAVEIIGRTDDVPGGSGPFKSNAELGAARAAVVAAALRTGARLPGSMLDIGLDRGQLPSSSNKNDDERRRNRTAVLVITAQGR